MIPSIETFGSISFHGLVLFSPDATHATRHERDRAGRDVSHLRITSADHCRDGIISERAAEYLGLLHQNRLAAAT